MRHILTLPLLFVALLGLIFTGCATTGKPTSAEAELTKGIAVVIEANKAATKSVIDLDQRGAIEHDLAVQILTVNKRVAQSGKAAVEALDSAQPLAVKLVAVNALIDAVQFTPELQRQLSNPALKPSVAALLVAIDSLKGLAATWEKQQRPQSLRMPTYQLAHAR